MAAPEPTSPIDEPGEVSVEQRVVLVDSPGGIALTLTPLPKRAGNA